MIYIFDNFSYSRYKYQDSDKDENDNEYKPIDQSELNDQSADNNNVYMRNSS